MQGYLRADGIESVHCASGEQAQKYLVHHSPAALLLDLKLPGINGLDLLQWVVEQGLPLPVIVVTDEDSSEIVVKAMQMGALDFIVKPVEIERLRVSLRNAVRQEELSAIVDSYREMDRRQFHGFIGESKAMQAVYRTIENIAGSKASVFIRGESGTGKELCAEAIHVESPRRDGPFIPVNCAAIPRELMESEIFGHVKGAFTGALRARDGAATLADGGTLFLDEVCEMDLDLQGKLLRFIQSGAFQKVGESRLSKVDVRFVSATNKDPKKEVAAGRFREDLYYRLHVIPVVLPPLRERDDDVLVIARHLLKAYASEEGKAFTGFTRAAEAALTSYDWPGNVRELQNLVRQTVVLNNGELVSLAMLPSPLAETLPVQAEDSMISSPVAGELAQGDGEVSLLGREGGIRPLWEVERDAIEQAISLCGDNIPKAAALLGISASTIYRKRKSWGIE